MQIRIDKNQGIPLYWQISDQIKEKIITGQLPDGAVLPSERAMAQRLGVHRNTVIKAYTHLKDEELLESEQGVGYSVTYRSEDYYEPDAVSYTHLDVYKRQLLLLSAFCRRCL